MDPSNTLTLTEAMATEPLWLKSWLFLLVTTHFAAVLFVVGRESGRWRVRAEPIAILASFFAAAVLMNWLYTQLGYVRLLGLAHLVFWTPAYLWVLSRRRAIGRASLFGKYVHAYLVIAGISLAIDAVDVVRYLVGQSAPLLHRWG
jgi:hypothetical protein